MEIKLCQTELQLLKGIERGKYSYIRDLPSLLKKKLITDFPCNGLGKADEAGNYTAYKLTLLGKQALRDLEE
jgi:hypothetical protein